MYSAIRLSVSVQCSDKDNIALAYSLYHAAIASNELHGRDCIAHRPIPHQHH